MCGYCVVLCAMGKKEAFVWSSRGWTMSQPYASRDARGDGEGDGDGRRGIVMDADEDVRDLVRGLVGASASSTRRLARGTNGRCLNRGDDGTRDDLCIITLAELEAELHRGVSITLAEAARL